MPESLRSIERHIGSVDKLTMNYVRRFVDFDNFLGYLFSIVFCGTHDAMQGIAYRDNNKTPALWRWVSWDMDHSFIDYGAGFKQGKRPLWEQETFELVMTDRAYRKEGEPPTRIGIGDLRAVIFTRLLYEDPEFKKFLIKKVENWLSRELDQESLGKLSKKFKTLLGDKYPPERDNFLANRGEYVRKEMYRILDTLPYWKAAP
jgi:hypothetical protein